MSRLRVALVGGLLPCALLLAAAPLQAASILVANPSFELDSFPTFPGYVGQPGNPGAISGWTHAGGVGINAFPGDPFGDNGLVPDRNQIAFIQGAGSLSQVLAGFDTTKQYWLQGWVNARNCCGDIPVAEVKYNGVSLSGSVSLVPLEAPGSHTVPYYFVHIPFIPTAASGTLEVTSFPAAGGDASLVVDAINIIQRDPDEIVIINPSFEASGSALPFPGYIGAPAQIAGWTYTDLGGGNKGTNDAGGPFHDNGLIPDGTSVALLQQPGALSQMINGLIVGQLYELSYFYNSRAATSPPHLRVEIGGLLAQDADVFAVGGANPYHQHTFQFAATAASMLLSFTQTLPFPPTDQTVLLDDVSIRPVPEPGSLLLAGLGLLGVGWFATRRRAPAH
jgi:hypothetical protein